VFTLHIEIDGVLHKLDTMADNASDLTPALRRFGAYLKKRARERYQAQDFAPLAPSTIAKRAQRGLRSVERSLSKKVKQSIRKAGGAGTLGMIMGLQSKSVQRNLTTLSEFQKRHRRKLSSRAEGDLKPLTVRQLASLGSREDKAIAKAVSGPILGKLIGSLEVQVEGASVTLRSRTRQHWTEAHNKGDGHVPQRETIKIETSDLTVLSEILREHITKAE
jgi:hypothetical protein